MLPASTAGGNFAVNFGAYATPADADAPFVVTPAVSRVAPGAGQQIRVMVAGKTFRYTAEGPQGLAGGKKLVVAATYGGQHPLESGRNFVEPYLRQVFGFIGIADVEFIDAAGLNISPEQRSLALETAEQRIEAMPLPLAA